jgi:hypothetical protein
MFNFDRFISNLIFLSIVILPLYSYGEVLTLLFGTLKSQSVVATPVVIKLIKDFFVIIVFITFFIKTIYLSSMSARALVLLFLIFLATVPSVIWSLNNDFLNLISGARWLIPFFLLVILVSSSDLDFLISRISKVLPMLLMVNLILQIYQLFYSGSWFGSLMGVYSLRNPGFFLIPSTSAFFTIMSFLYLYFLSDFNKRLLYLLATTSVLLTFSVSAIFVLLSIIVYLFFKNRINLAKDATSLVLMILIVLLLPSIIAILPYLGRGEQFLEISGGTRFSIFLESIQGAHIISSNFGYGTNSAVLLSKVFSNTSSLITDSAYTSLIINLGFWGFGFYLCLASYTFLLALKENSSIYLIVVYVMFSYSFVANWMESFPFNYLIVILLAKLIRRRKEIDTSDCYYRKA